jgi:hypothetical protein
MDITQEAQKVLSEVLKTLEIDDTANLAPPQIELIENTERKQADREFFEQIWRPPTEIVTLNTPWNRDDPLDTIFRDHEEIIRTNGFIEFCLKRNSSYARSDKGGKSTVHPSISTMSSDERRLTLAGILTYHAISSYFGQFYSDFVERQKDRAVTQANFAGSHFPKTYMGVMARQTAEFKRYATALDGLAEYVQGEIISEKNEISKMWEAYLFVCSELDHWAKGALDASNLIKGIKAKGHSPITLIQKIPLLNEIENNDVQGYLDRVTI